MIGSSWLVSRKFAVCRARTATPGSAHSAPGGVALELWDDDASQRSPAPRRRASPPRDVELQQQVPLRRFSQRRSGSSSASRITLCQLSRVIALLGELADDIVLYCVCVASWAIFSWEDVVMQRTGALGKPDAGLRVPCNAPGYQSSDEAHEMRRLWSVVVSDGGASGTTPTHS